MRYPTIFIMAGCVEEVRGVGKYNLVDFDVLEGGDCPVCYEQIDTWKTSIKCECGYMEGMSYEQIIELLNCNCEVRQMKNATEEKGNERISTALRVDVQNFAMYHDGFSFTVPTELEAYKAAYKYRYNKKTRVQYAPNVDRWSVNVYKEE